MEAHTTGSLRAALQEFIQQKVSSGQEFLRLTHQALCLYAETSNETLFELVMLCYRPRIRNFAQPYCRPSIELMDLEQTVLLALVGALRRFDPSRSQLELAAYVNQTISGTLKKYIRDKVRIARVNRRFQELGTEIRRAERRLEQKGQAATPRTIANELGVPEKEVVEALVALGAFGYISLGRPINSDGNPGGILTLGDTLGAIDPRFELAEELADLKPALAVLTKREQAVIAYYYFGEASQSEVARKLGISQMHVSRLLSQALGKMRNALMPHPNPLEPAEASPPTQNSLPQAVECLARDGLVSKLGVSYAWLDKRLPHFRHLGGPCICGNHRSDTVCYDREVLDEMRKLKQLLTVKDIARSIGRSEGWVTRRLGPYRRDAITVGNRQLYPPEVLANLSQQAAI